MVGCEMAKSMNFVLALFTLVVVLSACVSNVVCWKVDPTNLKEVELAAKQNEIDEFRSWPNLSMETNDGRIDAYGYLTGQTCVDLPWAPYPIDLPDNKYFTIAYDADGSFSSFRVWGTAASAEEAIALHQKSIAYGGSGEKQESEDLPMVLRMEDFEQICTQAQSGDPYAQSEIGFAYWHGNFPVELNLVEAYKWLSLAVANSDTSSAHLSVGEKARWRRDQVAKEMTAEQLSEAELRVNDWVPSSTECDVSVGAS